MYTVYVLQDKNGKTYKGLTSNLQRRLKEHKSGNTKSTKNMDMNSLQVVYHEIFTSRIDARFREKYLKSAAGRKFLKKILYSE